MNKITFIWSNVTHEGKITSINTLGAYQIIHIEDVHIKNEPAAYLTFSIMVSEIKIGKHGPVTIVSMEKTIFSKPVKMI